MYASSPGASRVPQRSQELRISRAMRRTLTNELDPDGLRERADLFTAAQELANRAPPFFAVVLGELVHVHADEAVGQLVVEAATELAGGLGRWLTVVEARADRLGEHVGELAQRVWPEIAPSHVRAERQRQPRVLATPHCARG